MFIHIPVGEVAAQHLEHEERVCRARRLLDAAGLDPDAIKSTIATADKQAREAAHSSVRPNPEVYAETFDHLIDVVANGDPNDAKIKQFAANRAFAEHLDAERGIRWGIWR